MTLEGRGRAPPCGGAAADRQHLFSRGRDGQRRAACTWRIEEGGHHDLGEAGTQLAQDELAKTLCERHPWLGVTTWHRDEFDESGFAKWDAWWEYREVDLAEYTLRGRRAMQAACVLRRLAMARVLAEHGSPRLTWEVLRNLDWSKLTSGVFAECEEYTTNYICC